jgi:hypothetical protein
MEKYATVRALRSPVSARDERSGLLMEKDFLVSRPKAG